MWHTPLLPVVSLLPCLSVVSLLPLFSVVSRLSRLSLVSLTTIFSGVTLITLIRGRSRAARLATACFNSIIKHPCITCHQTPRPACLHACTVQVLDFKTLVDYVTYQLCANGQPGRSLTNSAMTDKKSILFEIMQSQSSSKGAYRGWVGP